MTIIPKDSLPGINSYIKKDRVSRSKKNEKFEKVLNDKTNKNSPIPKNSYPESVKPVKDFTNISSDSKDMLIAKKAIGDAPDVREDLVEQIKNEIKNGTYEMDMEKLADRLLDSGIFDDLL